MPAPPPASLALLGGRVGERIDGLLDAEQTRWGAIDPDLDAPLAALRAMLAGGKRLRPAFCHWGFVGGGGDPDDPRIVDAGAALELVHAAALAHDDIVDGSVRRHGRPCLHVDLAGHHRARAWHGDSRRFGEAAALLIGDLAFAYADAVIGAAPAPVMEVFAELRVEVNIGQYLDLAGTASRRASLDQAKRICVYKSAKYTIERPLHLGAALAGRLADLAGPYTAFGVPLGEAFQLRDDLLGAFGDGDKLGKAVDEDVREGKPTALYAIARERASGPDVELLRDRYGEPDLGPDEVVAIRAAFVSTGARSDVEGRIEALITSAVQALGKAPITEPARAELGALARFIGERDH